MEPNRAVRDGPSWERGHDLAKEGSPSGRDPDRQLILVVEDEPHDWEIYGKMLWYNGFDVLYARDGTEGLALARDYRPDLVLLDLGLPGMDGLEMCRRLKEDPATSGVPVLILTARPEGEYGDEARLAGCDRYLEKPKTPLEVLNEVESVIGPAPPGAEGRPPEVERPPK